MDKRQEKTVQAIFSAFALLINTKDYDDITIQDILDVSKVGRSTFYCHFKTKNDLLLEISNHIFNHVFSHSLQEEKSHDFSKDNFYDYKHLITHILYHIRDEKELMKGIFSSKGNTIFLQEFKRHLYRFGDSYYYNYPYNDALQVPLKLKKAILVENFIVLLRYWIDNEFQESPELITKYFLSFFYTRLER